MPTHLWLAPVTTSCQPCMGPAASSGKRFGQTQRHVYRRVRRHLDGRWHHNAIFVSTPEAAVLTNQFGQHACVAIDE
jgi:hypothetical protein